MTLSLGYLDEALEYDREAGELWWSLDRPRHHFTSDRAWKNYISRDSGRKAGSFNKGSGYWQVSVGGSVILKHRAIFAMHFRIEPVDLPPKLDHKDRDTSHNHIDNLRPATSSENGCNMGLNSNNKSGVKGVHWHKSNQKWVARVKIGGKQYHVGYFNDLDAARAAREAAANDLHGDFVRHASYIDQAA